MEDDRLNQDMTAAEDVSPEAVQSPSLIGWICMLLLPLIPVAGTVAYIVVLFLRSFKANENPTVRTWARASLIIIAARIVITVLICVLLELRFSVFSLIFGLIGKML